MKNQLMQKAKAANMSLVVLLLRLFLTTLPFFTCGITLIAQQTALFSPKDLKEMSIEDLMNIEVTLVSRSPQKLTQSASAVQVITGEDIRNSGADNIAEALRLVANLQVAQMRSNTWLIGSRGFNTLFANKLLVMIDGRTVYTPLFAGVFWDIQNVLLEDVDRIEVVSGPGGTLWGANAVNGVINIVTKSTTETSGLYASAVAGTFIKDHASVRYGGKVGKNFSYKVYGQHFDRDNTKQANGDDFKDAWRMTQGGFRMDWGTGGKDSYTVQGDYYGGTVKTAKTNSDFNGQNILGRWRRTLSENSDLMVQIYYDRYFKADGPGLTSDKLNTADLEFQHRFPIKKHQSITWGGGYRRVHDQFVSATPFVAMLPEKKNLDLASFFVQDEIVFSKFFKLAAGTKIVHNVYTGFEVQPSAHMSYLVNTNNTLWAAVSRAVRTPSRIDVDYFSPVAPQPPTAVSVRGGPDFVSEKLMAYEAGYRLQPNSKSTFSLSTFYNRYSDIYSLEALPGTLTYRQQNGTEGESWGIEFAGVYQLSNDWRVRFGYTYLDMELKAKQGHVFDPGYLANDVKHQAMLQSMANLPFNLHLDLIGRYLSSIPKSLVTPKVPAYFTFDARLAYSLKFAELSLVGQNLSKKNHTEFSSLLVPRGYYAKLSVRL